MSDANQLEDQNQDPSSSQLENQNTGDDDELEPGTPAGEDTDPGRQSGAEARIRQLSKAKNEAAKEAEHWKNIAARFAQTDNHSTAQPPAQSDQNQYSTDEVEKAYRTLAQRGMATQADLEKMALRMQWDRKHDQNEQRFSSNKYPSYDRQEVEEYARNHNIGDPTAAYRDMYFDEIMDAVRSENRGRKPTNNTEKPTKPDGSAKEPLTLEGFREKLANDPKYYEEMSKDPAKFDATLAELAKAG